MRLRSIACLTLLLLAPVLAAAAVSNGSAASASARNGRNINPWILRRLGLPKIGTTFKLQLDCTEYPPGIFIQGRAYIVIYVLGHPGRVVPAGELLVDTSSPLGIYIASIQFGTTNTYPIKVPLDVALCGMTGTAQGACQDETLHLSNAIDMVIGT